MTREEALEFIAQSVKSDVDMAKVADALNALEQEPTIKALGEELRKAREGIADEKVLIGYNMAVAICNKHLGESEG